MAKLNAAPAAKAPAQLGVISRQHQRGIAFKQVREGPRSFIAKS